jgi:DNA-binding LacI/PurR family transcriptional regulator
VYTLSAGDSMLTELAQPLITAVYFSVADQCRHAVELLVGMMNGQRPTLCGHRIPVHLHCPRQHGPARAGS